MATSADFRQHIQDAANTIEEYREVSDEFLRRAADALRREDVEYAASLMRDFEFRARCLEMLVKVAYSARVNARRLDSHLN